MVTINPELFVLNGKTEEEYILYAPMPGSALVVNGAVIKQLQDIQKGFSVELSEELNNNLRKYGIIAETFPEIKKRNEPNEYKPTSVTLLPTWNCQLRCIYCYSHGGEDIKKDMTFDIAKSSIDLIINNANELKSKSIQIGFHGGGEPLLPKNLPLLDEILDYARTEARKYNLQFKANAVTNAVMSDKTIEWVLKNINGINVSWDGLPEIQDIQRPIRGDKGSSKYVLHTLRVFDEHKYSYGVRATVTQRSVNLLPEIVEFLAENTNTKSIHLEQLFSCGRCEDSGEKPPREEDFIAQYLIASELAKKYDIKLNNSCADISTTRDKFCGAAGSNFFVTPAGDVTTCLEVTRIDDPAREIFFIGKYNQKNNAFEFDQNKINFLRSRTTDSMKGCGDCFAKHACSGDCLAKVFAATGSLYGTEDGGYRCKTNRALVKEDLYSKLSNNIGVKQ